jgi:peptidoglycan L-alanyl-D-glutamate endopeptidase CwlK
MDQISESRLAEVHPLLANKVRQVALIMAQGGIAIRVVQALRTIQQQDALYAMGRTAPGKVVTNCQGGKSYHNFGLAVDCVPSSQDPDKPFAPDWNANHPTWKRMIEVAQSVALDCGATWRTFKDFPHFQLTGRFPEGEPNQELHIIFNSGGLPAVWDAVTRSIDPATEEQSNAVSGS